MTGPRYTALASQLPAAVPFVGPEAQERARARPFRARLGANESAFGPSPAAVEAMRRAATDTWMYGDPENHDLRQSLAGHHAIRPETIAIGEGIDALLGYLVRLLIAPGDAVVTSAGAYPTFNYHVAGHGGVLHTVPYRDDHEDPEALVACAAATGAKLLYLANPDNPMGSYHRAARIAALLDALPDGCLLVLDEAYVEFAPADAILPFDTTDPRLIRMRTFSKAYGMAGARLGYAIAAPELARAFDKIRNHFAVNRIAQAGALAALADRDHLQATVARVAAARDAIGEIARANGLAPLPSATNFVAMDCGADGAFARRVLQALAARDIFVRMPFTAPQDRCIRISCAPPAMLDILARALPDALTDALTDARAG